MVIAKKEENVLHGLLLNYLHYHLHQLNHHLHHHYLQSFTTTFITHLHNPDKRLCWHEVSPGLASITFFTVVRQSLSDVFSIMNIIEAKIQGHGTRKSSAIIASFRYNHRHSQLPSWDAIYLAIAISLPRTVPKCRPLSPSLVKHVTSWRQSAPQPSTRSTAHYCCGYH